MINPPFQKVPRHVAIIMDGNRRWAKQKGLPISEGHKRGAETLTNIIEVASNLGVEVLTVYAFSTENWNRPKEEVDFLMQFLDRVFKRQLEEVQKNKGRIRVIGRRDEIVPTHVLEIIRDAEEKTAQNTGITIITAFNYGGRAEIADAAQSLAQQVERGALHSEDIDEKVFARNLYAADIPDVDLLIRTSGEYRISNYLLWQAAYAEFVFTETLWPDFRREHLFDAIKEYQARDRRFGGL